MTRYLLTLLIYAVVMVILIFAARYYCGTMIWYPESRLYWFLVFIKDNLLFFSLIVFLIGWFIITYVYVSKPLAYLDELAGAAEKLVRPTGDPILLPGDLSYLEGELNRAREQALENARAAKDAEQRKNDLVVYLAHDLKTPLTSVIGYLTLLHEEKEISKETRERYISISLEKAERLEDLINEFFDITRFNLTEITLDCSRFNPARLLEQIVFEFGPMLAEKNLKCELDMRQDLTVQWDADKMQRVFDNLLRNAVNYSYPNSTIQILGTFEDGIIRIRFRNHGNTIPPEKLERIFEQFYRVDKARGSGTGGTGLGLAIAKEIVGHHNGTICAVSENEIIEFEVRIPSNPVT